MEEDLSKEKFYVAILAAIQVSHIIDFVIMMPLGPTLMEEFKIGPGEFAALVSSYNFSSAIVGLLFSIIADRFDRKSILLFSITGFTIGTFFCGLSQGHEQLLLARVLTGALGGVLNTSVMAITTDLVPIERRGRAMGIIMSAFSISSVVGIPIGLAISDHFGWHWSFYVIAGFAGFVGILAFFKIPNLKGHIRHVNAVETLKKFLQMVIKPEYFRGHLMIFMMASATFSLIPFLSPYSVKNVGLDTTELKYLYLVGGFFTVFTARFIGKMTDKLGAFKVFSYMLVLSFIPIWLYTNATEMKLAPYLVLTTFFMTIVSGRMIPSMTLLSTIPRMEDRGSFMGVLNSIRSLGSASAAIGAGMIISESSEGKLVNMDLVGYISICIAIFIIPLAYIINKKRE